MNTAMTTQNSGSYNGFGTCAPRLERNTPSPTTKALRGVGNTRTSRPCTIKICTNTGTLRTYSM